MPPRYAETLCRHIEHSPFSEAVMFIADDGWITDDGGERSVAFESAFDGCGAADYRLVPLDGGETGVVMRGIFDESVERDEGSKATRRKPRVILFAWPREARAGTRVIIRGREFAVTSFEADANLGTVGWLR